MEENTSMFFIGSVVYTAPEVLAGLPRSKQGDVFSYGQLCSL